MNKYHQPVLLKETLELLQVRKDEKYIDATLGSGGHSLEIIKRGGLLLGIDWDPEMIKIVKGRFSACPNALWQLKEGNFKDLKKIAEAAGFLGAAGMIADLGLSSLQIKNFNRGFSFQDQGSLDMRLNPGLTRTAKDLINSLNQDELSEIFQRLVQEKLARPIAQSVVKSRRLRPIATAKDLAEIIERVKPRVKGKLHPATKVFLALRILVNQEFENLKALLEASLEVLKPGGRLLIISFHSGEDRLVKLEFRKLKKQKKALLLTKKPIEAGAKEVAANPLARSAKLRAIEKK